MVLRTATEIPSSKMTTSLRADSSSSSISAADSSSMASIRLVYCGLIVES
jgi:hypothetical protein